MDQTNAQPSQKKPVSQKRKLINKMRKKLKKHNLSMAKAYACTDNKSSGLGTFMNSDQQQMDFDMANHISTGQKRKMKKKMKKLQKKFQGNDAKERIFKEVQRYKESIIKNQEKTIFNPASELEKRRERRMKRMQMNARNSKKQVMQKIPK